MFLVSTLHCTTICYSGPYFRIFRGEFGLRIHLQKSITCKLKSEARKSSKACVCVKKEVWLAPPPEVRSPWDCPYITKEIFIKALGLKQTRDMVYDDDSFLYEEDLFESQNTANTLEEVAVTETELEVASYEDRYLPKSEYSEQSPEIEKQMEGEEIAPNLFTGSMVVYQCLDCSKTFKERRRLVDHERDVHSGRKNCTFCLQTFSCKRTLTRHLAEIHNRGEENELCSNCGQTFSRKSGLMKHEEKCLEGTLWRRSNVKPKLTCQYCTKEFSSKAAVKLHEKNKHLVQMPNGYMLVPDIPVDNKSEPEYICKVCPTPQKFKSKATMKIHMVRRHNGTNYQINYGSSIRYLSQNEVDSQEYKTIKCDECKEEFSCEQNLNIHKKDVHGLEVSLSFQCDVCLKTFSKRCLMKSHRSRVHRTPLYECKECGKKTKYYFHHLSHVKIHSSNKKCNLKPLSSLKKSQKRERMKKEVEKMKRALFQVPDDVQMSMWKDLLNDCPIYFDKIKENPITEEEVINIIKDNNLSDRQVLNICKFIRNKWGREAITVNIAKKLINRKNILDQFFTEIRLDSTTNLHFKSKKGKSLSRSVTYCHDIPGLIAFIKLVVNLDESKEIMNVIGIDYGKSILKIVWNWSLMTSRDKGKKKLMGPKRSLVLAAVSKVQESHHNLSVLMQLTNLNEIEYNLSMDLKLINISIGICSHSSKFPCPYGECYRDGTGHWIKGRDRTVGNIREQRNKWMQRSRNKKGNRLNLKKYMNCENDPLLNGDHGDQIIKIVPPPPLHTILLGPVNHVFKELKKVYPNIMGKVSKLHIQRSKYHGRQFEGNQCRDLLNSIHKLEIPDSFKVFRDVFLAIKDLHHLCNEQLLSCYYPKIIDNFRRAWFKLTDEFNVSTTPKIHILLDHLEDYFDLTDVTLIKTSDELCENMHQFLHKRLIRSYYTVKDLSNPSHGQRLFRAVKHLNSYNLCIERK